MYCHRRDVGATPLVGNVGHVVSAQFFENADMTTSRRHVGDMSATCRRHVGDTSARHVADMVVVMTIFGATPLAPCRHAHDMPTTWLKVSSILMIVVIIVQRMLLINTN